MVRALSISAKHANINKQGKILRVKSTVTWVSIYCCVTQGKHKGLTVNISDAIMEVLIIFQLLLLLGASPTECQQCTNQDWTSTFAVAGDSMSQCNTNRSYVNALISQGYGVNLQTGPSIIEMARCCGVNLPYSQESNDCYWAQWWVWSHDSWVTCKTGYLVHGFFTIGPNFLSDIGMAQCCKPSSHPEEDGTCDVKQVDFKVDGTKECDEGFFLKGLKKSFCSTIDCLTEIRCCRMVPGRVDGGWSDWRGWQPCSTTCGPGSQRRFRDCTNPPPSGGGSMCSGLPFESRSCNSGPCPVDGGWSDWTDWGACSVTCGSGSQQRSRTCTNPPPSGGGADCSGAQIESRECVLSPCPPVDGGWSDWSDWSQCSYDCGWNGGEQTATRTCTNPPPSSGGRDCTGNSEKKQVCNKFRCQFDQWSQWGPCDKSCGGGTQTKTRNCLTGNGQRCFGKTRKTQDCNTQNCP